MNSMTEALFNAMYERLKDSSSMLAFVQARVSGEAFVRNECAFAATNYLERKKYHVHMEKQYEGKTVDLLIYDVEDGMQKREPEYQFELKMAWPGGLAENSTGVQDDLRALQGRKNAWSLVHFFTFEMTEPGFPYQPTKVNFDDGLREFIDRVAAGPPKWQSPALEMSFGNSTGRACLLAWPAAAPV